MHDFLNTFQNLEGNDDPETPMYGVYDSQNRICNMKKEKNLDNERSSKKKKYTFGKGRSKRKKKSEN